LATVRTSARRAEHESEIARDRAAGVDAGHDRVDHLIGNIADAAHRLSGNDNVMGLVVGNELPVDVVRWVGTAHAVDPISGLSDAVAEVDPTRLKTYGNYPTTEYLDVAALDFLMFNVYLEDRLAFRYVTKLLHLAGERPVVLGEIGLDAGAGHAGERHQAEVIDWQLETATEAVRSSGRSGVRSDSPNERSAKSWPGGAYDPHLLALGRGRSLF